MNSILAPVKPDSPRPRIIALQQALAFLIEREVLRVAPGLGEPAEVLEALRHERQTQEYGERTRKLVSYFQDQHHLGGDGLVDPPTADAINAALRELGVLNERPADATHALVGGTVRGADKLAFQGLVVLSLEWNAASLPLGQSTTDPDGRYSIAYVLPLGMEDYALQLTVFDADRRRRTQARARGTTPVEVVDLEVPESAGTYRVVGRVASAASIAVNGLRVRLVDKNIGGDTLLAEVDTNADGAYRAELAYAGDKKRPDLQVYAFRGETLLGSSTVHYNATNVETIDVLVQETAQAALATEHETLVNELAAHFKGKLSDLKEAGVQQDITFLANKSGWDARAVAMASVADRFSADATDADGGAGIAPAYFYALFRAGLPVNDAALYRSPPTHVEAVWKQAIAQGLIPTGLEAQMPATLDRFRAMAARQALDAPAASGHSTLGELLKISLPDANAEQRQQFAALQIEQAGKPDDFWKAVKASFGEDSMKRLRLDGQLAFLTLNNAPLVGKLHAAVAGGIKTPADLVSQGYYRPQKWQGLISVDMLPPEIEGDNAPVKMSRYAEVLAAQLRLTYPTATLAAMVRSGETPIAAAPPEKVHDFLVRYHEQFDIGMETVEQFVKRQGIEAETEVVREITRIQRVRQITPDDAAMNVLLQQGLDSAQAVARYGREEFVAAFADKIGGVQQAVVLHAKAQQVHGAVLNLALSYLVASNAPPVGVHSPPQYIAPAPNVPDNVGDVIAYASLEKLLGEMDYCECEHCRSILSPAAYLVDMLQFLDYDSTRWTQFRAQWKNRHGGVPYPYSYASLQEWTNAGSPPEVTLTPLDILLSRRPDLQSLPLTCENTNTALPYIDLVNETLEHFVANGMALGNYQGHTTDSQASPQELLASPQYVQDAAYELLAGDANPGPPMPPASPLPFHRNLERLRRLFGAFDTPLPRVMQTLRKNEALERANADGYGWRDIWMEELRMSRAEYALLTDRTLSVQALYGYPGGTLQDDVLTEMSKAQAFCRRLGVSYEELAAILETRFINPAGTLIPRLQRLRLPLKTIRDLKDGVLSEQAVNNLIAPLMLDAAQYGGSIVAWLTNQNNYDRIMGLLVLTDPNGTADVGSFERLELRYADPAKLSQKIRPFEFVRLLRFVRLWKKLGWSIEHTDKAITALYPQEQWPDDPDDTVNLQRIDAGFLALLPRLGIVKRVLDELHLKPRSDLLPLLSCFAAIDTYGKTSLYQQLFLKAALAADDKAFAGDGYGNFLGGANKLMQHEEALRAAMALTADEFRQATDAAGYDANTPLNVAIVSALFRRAWLARKLKISVREMLLLTAQSGIDPFAAWDPVRPPILRFLELVKSLQTAGLKPAQALYLVWNQDLSGTVSTDDTQINDIARRLRGAFGTIEQEFSVADDPDGQIAQARMSLVYDTAATDLFFGLLNNTVVIRTSYSQKESLLAQAILDAAPERIRYDDFRKELSYAGRMNEARRDALKATAGASDAFKAAVDMLYDESQRLTSPFFARYPELLELHEAYIQSADPLEQRRSALLAAFLPTLKQRRKHQEAMQIIGAAVKSDAHLAATVLGTASVLHAAGDKGKAAIEDVVQLERAGLSVSYYFQGAITEVADHSSVADALLDYRAGGPVQLPNNGGNSLTAVWTGYLEAPSTDFYKMRVEADNGAEVVLNIGGVDVPLERAGKYWLNVTPIELRAGAPAPIVLTAKKLKTTFCLQWQVQGLGWEIIPARFLYPGMLVSHFRAAVGRFFKVASLCAALKLDAEEIAYLGAHADYRSDGNGWLNALPVDTTLDDPKAAALLTPLAGVLGYARIKNALAPNDARLLTVMQRPSAAMEQPDGLLYALTRWEPGSLKSLLKHFGKTGDDLAHIDSLLRLVDAFDLLRKTGISADALVPAATNAPSADIVRKLQASLRARYEESDWLALIKPINDALREAQRDALVATILHHLRSDPRSSHIDTPEKLFEYFLMDVQMAACTQTSRIRHALSSIQLFTERCLLNLEPRVAPSALSATQWEWMKRYRVWEANRKIFLWPENWLEPELRDDQSPFFREMMSELLQGDITEDRAGAAFAGYLVKLDQVAKLEPCGMHVVENDTGTDDDVCHVVARTSGGNRRYYYRRREHGSWTPWEDIKLDIEDNPVAPVVWKGRLFLIWLRLMKPMVQPTGQPVPSDKNLADIKPAEIQNEGARTEVQAILCWSEYYNRHWQTVRTSDPAAPFSFRLSGGYPVTGPRAFDRDHLRLTLRETVDQGLWISIHDISYLTFPKQKPNRIAIILYNTHGGPATAQDNTVFVAGGGHSRSLFRDGSLRVMYFGGLPKFQRILSSKFALPFRTVEPVHSLNDAWRAPFFYDDQMHVFYVTPEDRTVTVSTFQGYGGSGGKAVLPPKAIVIPPLIFEKPPQFKIPDLLGPVAYEKPVDRFVSEDVYIKKGLGTLDAMRIGDIDLGPSGALGPQR
jgi:hypothetical protein